MSGGRKGLGNQANIQVVLVREGTPTEGLFRVSAAGGAGAGCCGNRSGRGSGRGNPANVQVVPRRLGRGKDVRAVSPRAFRCNKHRRGSCAPARRPTSARARLRYADSGPLLSGSVRHGGRRRLGSLPRRPTGARAGEIPPRRLAASYSALKERPRPRPEGGPPPPRVATQWSLRRFSDSKTLSRRSGSHSEGGPLRRRCRALRPSRRPRSSSGPGCTSDAVAAEDLPLGPGPGARRAPAAAREQGRPGPTASTHPLAPPTQAPGAAPQPPTHPCTKKDPTALPGWQHPYQDGESHFNE